MTTRKVTTNAVFYETQFNYGRSAGDWGISDRSLFVSRKDAQSYIDNKIATEQPFNSGEKPDYWTIVERTNLKINDSVDALDRDEINFAPFGGYGPVVSDTIVNNVWNAMFSWDSPQVVYLNNQMRDAGVSAEDQLLHRRYLLDDLNFSYKLNKQIFAHQHLNREQLHALLYIAKGGSLVDAMNHAAGIKS